MDMIFPDTVIHVLFNQPLTLHPWLSVWWVLHIYYIHTSNDHKLVTWSQHLFIDMCTRYSYVLTCIYILKRFNCVVCFCIYLIWFWIPCVCVAGPGSGDGVPSLCHLPVGCLGRVPKWKSNVPTPLREDVRAGQGWGAQFWQPGWWTRAGRQLGTPEFRQRYHAAAWRQVGCLHTRKSYTKRSRQPGVPPGRMRTRLLQAGSNWTQLIQTGFVGFGRNTQWTRLCRWALLGEHTPNSSINQQQHEYFHLWFSRRLQWVCLRVGM